MSSNKGLNFWLGNAILALALLLLLNMGALWEQMGMLAMVLWVITVGIGAYLVLSGQVDGGNGPT